METQLQMAEGSKDTQASSEKKVRGFAPSREEKAKNQAAAAKAYAHMRSCDQPLGRIQSRVKVLGATYPEWHHIGKVVRCRYYRCRG